jgi:hypothetical protein
MLSDYAELDHMTRHRPISSKIEVLRFIRIILKKYFNMLGNTRN